LFRAGKLRYYQRKNGNNGRGGFCEGDALSCDLNGEREKCMMGGLESARARVACVPMVFEQNISYVIDDDGYLFYFF